MCGKDTSTIYIYTQCICIFQTGSLNWFVASSCSLCSLEWSENDVGVKEKKKKQKRRATATAEAPPAAM